MQRTLEVLKALTLIVTIAVGASVFLVLLQISAAVKHADGALNGTFGALNGAVEHLDSAAATIDKDAVLGGKLINDARLSVDNVNKAAIDERFYFEQQLPAAMDHANGVLANLQQATADLHPLLIEATERTHDLAPIEDNAARLIGDVDVTARDPHIAASLVNLEASSAELAVASKDGAATMASVKAIAKDGQDTVHDLTHPKPLVKIADWTIKLSAAVSNFFHIP